MKSPVSLTVFFPAYNEEENLEESVSSALRVLKETPYVGQFEILIINDGSSDRTEEIADRLATQHEEVRAIHHPHNRGYGAALLSGIKAARMEYVFFTDADLQFDFVELQNLLIQLSRYDVVIGYRAPRRDPFMRLLNAKGWNALNRLLFGLHVRDIDCAFKVFKRVLIQSVRIRSRGAMINAELLIRLKRLGVTIKEVPVSHLPRLRGSPTGAKPSVILRAFKEMVRLYGGELGSPTHKQIMKFMIVGVINTLIDLSVYVFLTRVIPAFAQDLIAAKFFSFMCGTISSFFFNRLWTFGVRTRFAIAEIIRFYAVVSLAMLTNVAAMYFLVHVMDMYDLFALGLTTVLTFTINYTLSKIWVFRAHRAPEAEFA